MQVVQGAAAEAAEGQMAGTVGTKKKIEAGDKIKLCGYFGSILLVPARFQLVIKMQVRGRQRNLEEGVGQKRDPYQVAGSN